MFLVACNRPLTALGGTVDTGLSPAVAAATAAAIAAAAMAAAAAHGATHTCAVGVADVAGTAGVAAGSGRCTAACVLLILMPPLRLEGVGIWPGLFTPVHDVGADQNGCSCTYSNHQTACRSTWSVLECEFPETTVHVTQDHTWMHLESKIPLSMGSRHDCNTRNQSVSASWLQVSKCVSAMTKGIALTCSPA